jgi:hypothetical protein
MEFIVFFLAFVVVVIFMVLRALEKKLNIFISDFRSCLIEQHKVNQLQDQINRTFAKNLENLHCNQDEYEISDKDIHIPEYMKN